MKSLPCLAAALAALVIAVPSAAAAVSEAAASARSAAQEYGSAVRNCDLVWALDHMYPPLRRTLADRIASRDPRTEAQNARRIMGLERESEEAARARMQAADRALVNQYRKMGEAMKAQGFTVERYTVGEPYSEYVVAPSSVMVRPVLEDRKAEKRADALQAEADRSRIVVLPITLIVRVPDRRGQMQRMERKSYIYAIRDEVVTGINSRGTEINKWYFVDSNTDVNTLRTYFPALPLDIAVPATGDRMLP